MRRFSFPILFAVLLLLFAACGQTPTPQPPTDTPVPPTDTPVPPTDMPTPEEPLAGETPSVLTGDIVEILASLDQFTALSQAIEEADLAEKLKSDGPYTLFAPTDAAFDAVDADLLADPDMLFDIILYHVVEATLPAGEAAAQGSAVSLLGDELTFAADGDTLMVNDVPVAEVDLIADNGIVHVIEMVLMPPSLGSN